MEDTFRHTKGVINTAVGYCGGVTSHPTYEAVCSGRTGHAETVEVVFDPTVVSYRSLLDIFFSIHNPTVDLRGQRGGQYRSVIFYHSPEQQREAQSVVDQLQKSGKVRGQIMTQIVPEQKFWMAEDYHQQYYEKQHGGVCGVR